MSAGREVAGKKETDSGVESGVLVMMTVVVMATPHLSINREERQRSISLTRDTGYTTVIQQ